MREKKILTMNQEAVRTLSNGWTAKGSIFFSPIRFNPIGLCRFIWAVAVVIELDGSEEDKATSSCTLLDCMFVCHHIIR